MSWSDGGAVAHNISTPAANTTYTATFSRRRAGTDVDPRQLPARRRHRCRRDIWSTVALVYGDRGNGQTYGWNADNTAQMRDRDSAVSPDQRYDTLAYLQKPSNPDAVWEIAVPNGTYLVRAVAGDPAYFESTYRIAVEGVLTVSGTSSSASRWIEGTATVTVSDGRITIRSEPGAFANKICFVEITAPTAIRVNFQPASAPVPAGYLADGGLVYGERGNGQSYGWNTDNTAQMRDRNSAVSPDQRYDTLAVSAKTGEPRCGLGDCSPERDLPRPRGGRRPRVFREHIPDRGRGRAHSERDVEQRVSMDRRHGDGHRVGRPDHDSERSQARSRTRSVSSRSRRSSDSSVRDWGNGCLAPILLVPRTRPRRLAAA